MRYLKYLLGGMLTAALVACGGGGGSSGTTSSGGGSGTTGTGAGTVTTPVPTLALDLLGGSGTSTDAISTVEIATARVTLKDASGAAVKGVIVTFSQTGASLVTIAPVSATALTDANGQASVEIRAATTSSVGATSISAAVTLSSATLTAAKAFAVTSAPSSGTAAPQDLANALNFLDINPADKSIVLAGSGGNGRSESATLRFRVVDKNNSPVQGVSVTFTVAPPNNVTLNITSATSDSDGVVITTVSSKNVATAVVVRATVTGKSIVSQSDQLLVTTGVATQAGFDLSASKYNLNAGITGDSSSITVRIVDVNGNPVSDGVPVVFTVDYGGIGSSSRGGCLTAGGGCTVTYTIQAPRPPDGVPITVVASTQVGNGTSISKLLNLYASDPKNLDLFTATTGGATVPILVTDGTCAAQRFTTYVGTPAGYPAPADTAVSLTVVSLGTNASIISGSPIQDQRSVLKERTPLVIEVTPPSTGALPCTIGGNTSALAELQVKFTAGTLSPETRVVKVQYPRP